MNTQSLQSRWRQISLPAATLAMLLAGCSMPGKNPQQVTTASYQELVVDEGPPKKIKDPLSLKLRYAKWMEEIENYDEARANYQAVLQQRPKDIEAILGLARIDEAAGLLPTAEEGYNKALSLEPTSALAQNALGQYYSARGRMSEALPLLSDAMMADPANKVYRFHFAVALAKTGDTTAALPHLVQAVGEPTAHYNIAMILKSQGQHARAEEHLLRAVNKKPDFEPAQQALAQLRQQARAAGNYASRPQYSSQIQPAGHSRPASPASPRR